MLIVKLRARNPQQTSGAQGKRFLFILFIASVHPGVESHVSRHRKHRPPRLMQRGTFPILTVHLHTKHQLSL